MPLIIAGDSLPTTHIKVEYNGVEQTNIISIDTDTGFVSRYKQPLEVHENEAVIEEAYLDLDKLHIYVIKPKLQT
jgi:hypothetical protein